MNELDNELNPKILTLVMVTGALAVRLVMDTRHITVAMVCRSILFTAFVAILIGQLLADVQIPETAKNAIMGVGCFLAREFLEGLIELANQWKKDPKAFIESIRKGGK